MKKFFAAVLAVGMIALMSVSALAAEPTNDYNTPAEAVAGLTGRTMESVVSEHFDSEKTYGAIAKDAGVLDEFKAACLKLKKEALAEQVTEGKLTQEEADTILALMEANQALCEGKGTGNMGKANGAWKGSNGCGRGIGGGRGLKRNACPTAN